MPPRPLTRTIVAALVGNGLEWYDFLLYAMMSPYIARAFFPVRNPDSALLLAVATFGVGFVMRPVGALVLGQYADRFGRRAALSLVIGLMTLATAVLVFTPGWRSIGWAAPVLVVLSRLLQGFSVGGELGSSSALLLEAAPARRRAFFGSWQGATQHIASLTAAGAATLTTAVFSAAQLNAGWWRLPFVLGLLVGPVGLYIRRHLVDLAEQGGRLRADATPLRLLARRFSPRVARTIGLVALTTVATYVLELGMPAYAHRTLHIGLHAALLANLLAGLPGLIAGPAAGAAADRFGARRVMVPMLVGLSVLTVPGFLLLVRFPGFGVLLSVQMVLLTLRSAMTGPLLALAGSLFPTEVRSSALSVSYNLSVLLFGGFAPFVTTWMVIVSGNAHMPAAYVLGGAALTLAALLNWPVDRQEPLA